MIAHVSNSMPFTIRFDDASVARGVGPGSISGVILFEFGLHQFPAPNWRDFPFPILGWWLSACEKLTSGGAERQSLMFMDGPFEIEIEPISDVSVELRCIDRGQPESLRFFSVVRFEDLFEQIAKTASAVEDICASKGWADIVGYKDFVDRLRRKLANMQYKLPPIA